MSLREQITEMLDGGAPHQVWVPQDFARLGSRDAIDKALQRMVSADQLRRVDRGLYDRPRMNPLLRRVGGPDYLAIVEAIARRDRARLMPDGITAANEIGLTNAVPAKVVFHSDSRRRPLQVGALTVKFKLTSARRMYWADRPAMRVVQALHWLKDMLSYDGDRIRRRLGEILRDPIHGDAIRADLVEGFGLLPTWMQRFLRGLPELMPGADAKAKPTRRTRRAA